MDRESQKSALKNLKGFRADQTLKAATFQFISGLIVSKQEKENLSKVFKQFDKNGDGQLDMEEVRIGYEEHYGQIMTQDELEKMFKAVDLDNSGYIEYQEFVTAAINQKEMTTNENLLTAFKMFDKDGSGVITADEIRKVLGFGDTLSRKQIDRMIKQCDANGDGQIDFDEFVDMMRKLGE